MILRMISSGSLAAFSTVNQPAIGGARAPAHPAVQQARAPATTQQPQPLVAPQQSGGAKPGQVQGRPLPRGSLLDLSV